MADRESEIQQINELMESYRRLGAVTEEQADKAAVGTKAYQAYAASMMSARTVLTGFASGAVTATEALLKGAQGMQAMNGALDAAGGAAKGASKALFALGGPLGILAGAAMELFNLFTKVAKAANEQMDNEYKAFQNMQRAGGAASDGFANLARDAAKLGLDVSKLDSFVQTVNENGKYLAGFSGSVIEGRKQLANIGEALKDSREEFMRIGIGPEEVTNTIGSFIRMQTVYGNTQKRSAEDVAKSVKEYIYETDILTKLTGESRKEQERKMEDAMREEQFSAEIRRLQYAGQTEAAESLKNLRKTAGAFFGDEIAKGIGEFATGNLQGEFAQKLVMTLGPDMYDLQKKVVDKQMSETEFMEIVSKRLTEFDKGIGTTLGSVKALNSTFIGTEAMTRNMAYQNREWTKEKVDAEKDLTKLKESESDAQHNKQIKILKDLQDEQLREQERLRKTYGVTQAAMGAFTQALIKLTDALEKLLGWFLKKAPTSTAAPSAAGAKATSKELDKQLETLGEKIKSGTATPEEQAQYKKLESQAAQAGQQSVASQQNEARLIRNKRMEMQRAENDLAAKEGRKANQITNEQARSSVQAEQAKAAGGTLGALSSKFESGRSGSEAVGFDQKGGTSFGKYQIATRTGTMDKFLNYLEQANPEAAKRLRAAGPADTGKEGAFAQEWKKLVQEGKLQTEEHEFIKSTHYDVAMGKVSSGLQAMIAQSKALQEVMWSTSVQHGAAGAAAIFDKAYRQGMDERELIKAVYDARSTRFGGSTPEVRQSVMQRFQQEMADAIAMVGQPATAAEGAVLSGPASGYQPNLTMHGTEAVIPLKNGKVPVDMEMTADIMGALKASVISEVQQGSAAGSIMGMDMAGLVREIVSQIQQPNDVQYQILETLQQIQRDSSDTAGNSAKMARMAYN